MVTLECKHDQQRKIKLSNETTNNECSDNLSPFGHTVSTNHCLQMLSTYNAQLPKMSSWPFDTDRLRRAASLKILLAGRPLSLSLSRV